MSYTTRLMPFTRLMMAFDTSARKLSGSRAQSAVIPSREVTARRATTYSYVRSSPITPTLCTGNRMAPACQT